MRLVGVGGFWYNVTRYIVTLVSPFAVSRYNVVIVSPPLCRLAKQDQVRQALSHERRQDSFAT